MRLKGLLLAGAAIPAIAFGHPSVAQTIHRSDLPIVLAQNDGDKGKDKDNNKDKNNNKNNNNNDGNRNKNSNNNERQNQRQRATGRTAAISGKARRMNARSKSRIGKICARTHGSRT